MKKLPLFSIGTIIVLGATGLFYYLSDESLGSMDTGNARLVAQGKILYARDCAACHGKELQGQTVNWRQPLADGSLAAPPHDASGHTWHHPDKILFEITKYGRVKSTPATVRSNMPAFETKLSDEDIWAVLCFIKSKWPEQIRQRHDMLNERYRASQ